MSSAQVSEARIGRAVQIADHQRPDTERIAHPIEGVGGQGDQGVRALHLSERVDQALHHGRLLRAGDQVDDHLGIGSRLEQTTLLDQLAAERERVGQVAVVPERQAAEREVGVQRLDVAQQRRARGRVADVADRGVTGQRADHRLVAEVIADQPERPVAVEHPTVEADDAGRLLAAVLQGVQAEHGVGRGVVVAVDAEHAALLAQLVRGEHPMPGHRLRRPCRTHEHALPVARHPHRRCQSSHRKILGHQACSSRTAPSLT